MGNIFLLIVLFQYQLDPLLVDNRTRLELNGLKGNDVYTISFNPNEKELYVYDQSSGILSKKVSNQIINLDTLNPNIIAKTVLHYDFFNDRLLFLDAGLGRVFEYEFNSKTISRLDNSYMMRSFYGHVGFVTKDGDIFIYGGSGEFTTKNEVLLYKNDSQSEWQDYEYKNTRSSPKPEDYPLHLYQSNNLQNYLILFSYKDDLLYVRELSENFTKERVWDIKNKFKIQNGIVSQGSSLNQFSNYRKTGFELNIFGNYLYDHKRGILRRWVTDKNLFGIFESLNQEDSLHIVYNNNNDDNPLNLIIETYSVKDFFENNTFETLESIEDRRIKIILLLIVFLVITVFIYTNLRPKSQTTTIPILISDNSVIVRINNRKVVFSEKLEVDVLSLIEKLKVDEIDILELDQFDELLFSDRGHRSNQTTKRKKVIEKINQDLDRDFITTRKSGSDKRRKMIVFDYSIFE